MSFLPSQDRGYDADWQLRVAAMMNRLINQGAARNLPLVCWAVTSRAPQLLVSCDGFPVTDRMSVFVAWEDALTALAGPPDSRGQRMDTSSGTVRAWAVWDSYQRVRINLQAEWDKQTSNPETVE